MRQGYNAYKNAPIDTNDQGKLLLVTYDIAIKHAKLAIEKFDDKKLLEERGKHIYKIQDALEVLQQALNLDAGGEIAVNLYNLYSYMFSITVDANISNNRGPVEEVLGYLESLRAAWAEATLKAKAEATAEPELASVAVSA
ncbi:MAG: flagellar export chaperone FliS [Chitinispirillales bacterium]|nr:flagellar export chaperone FliS [Chitinispirillales bacterium]